MGGVTFKAKGSAGGAATQTVWMSFAADKYTMSSNYQNSGGTPNLANPNVLPTACNYGMNHNNINSTFGGFITAPDGTTNTFKKIVEDNTSSATHGIQGGIIHCEIIAGTFRVAAILKAAERTRAALFHFAGVGAQSYCGFDLSGGQIAYGGQIGDATVITNQIIQSLGSGVYLCFADFKRTAGPGGLSHGEDFRILLDSGTGTNAPSITYNGDNSSGLYCWRTSVLPPQAWSISSQCFFDDFTDPLMKNIDIQNTLVEGFDWYVSQPYFDTNTGQGNYLSVAIPPPPSAFAMSQSGSILTIPCQQTPGLGIPGGIHSASGTGNGSAPGTPVGKGWRAPFIYEVKMGYGNNQFNNGRWALDGFSMEFLNRTLAHLTNTDGNINGGELDIYEEAGHGPSANAFAWLPIKGFEGLSGGGLSNDPGSLGLNGIPTGLGYNLWQSGTTYNTTETVFKGGVCYQANKSTTTTPPSADWNTFTYPGSHPETPTVAIDFSQQHVTTCMMVPYDPVTGNKGMQLQWFDGVFTGCIQAWSPRDQIGNGSNNNQYFQTVDWQRWMLLIHMNDPVIPAPPNGYDMRIDYVKVMQ